MISGFAGEAALGLPNLVAGICFWQPWVFVDLTLLAMLLRHSAALEDSLGSGSVSWLLCLLSCVVVAEVLWCDAIPQSLC